MQVILADGIDVDFHFLCACCKPVPAAFSCTLGNKSAYTNNYNNPSAVEDLM